MLTAIAFLFVLLVVAALVAVAARFRAVRRLAVAAVRLLVRALNAGARWASRAADFLLAGRDGDVAAWRVALFAAAGALPLAIALALPYAPAVAAFVDPGWLLAAGLVFMLFVLLAAAFIVREDYNVMDGIVAEDQRRFAGARVAPNPAVVAVAVALVVVYFAAAAWWLMAVRGLPLVVQGRATGPAPLTYFFVALRALPTDALLSLLDRLTGDDTRVTVGPGLVPGAYFLAARLIGLAIILGLVIVAIEHLRQARRFLAEILASNTTRAELILRGRRAPRAVVRGILDAATVPGGGSPRQERLIAAAMDMGLLEFPALFCARLSTFTPELQGQGLDRAIEMFRYRTREFDAAQSQVLFDAAASALAAGTLELEPTKKLTRLMASVAIFKKDALQIPEAQKVAVMKTLKVELAKPRTRDDAALRGILRDLQAALGGEPIIIKPLAPIERGAEDWLRAVSLQAADRAVQPEIPSTTVH